MELAEPRGVYFADVVEENDLGGSGEFFFFFLSVFFSLYFLPFLFRFLIEVPAPFSLSFSFLGKSPRKIKEK